MPDVKIYTQPQCGYCNQLKEYLQKHNIKFEDKDITKDRAAMDELIHKYKVRATPLLVYGEKTVVGFNPDEIDKTLAGEEGRSAESAEAR